jgi:succinate dehydrogenase / fumarate reductase cytochrome b subunit
VPGPLVRRVFSLSGVFPLGAFLVVHILANASALRGDGAFDATVRALRGVPLRALAEVLLVFVPLALHAAIGVWLTVTRGTRAWTEEPSPYPAGVRVAMRVTGAAILVFLAMHLPEIRFRVASDGHAGGEIRTLLGADLSSTWRGVPWRGVAYLAAAGCVAFHFAAGLWGFVIGSLSGGDAASRRARLVAGWSAAVLGASLWFVLTEVVVLHATGARLVGEAAPQPAPSTGPCPP